MPALKRKIAFILEDRYGSRRDVLCELRGHCPYPASSAQPRRGGVTTLGWPNELETRRSALIFRNPCLYDTPLSQRRVETRSVGSSVVCTGEKDLGWKQMVLVAYSLR